MLETAGLTRAGKSRMSQEKVERATVLLEEKVFLHCTNPDCLTFAKASGKEPVSCEPRNTCQRCFGSDNARAVKDVLDACRKRGFSKLVIVGGSPTVRHELERLVPSALELRLVDGTKARPLDQARADLAWGDVVLLWGATELHHKVSNQYQDTATGPLKRKLVHVPRRGIAQLLAGLLTHLQR
ncbi:MAG: hypothetical protein Q8N23_07525 [Archangium sp.]|nr:hypothetical protein [Archangium sp.]MDP3152505.1 hypothetical protein [Archangium sp.]MDP3572325.1 hypothetical protein [Archangium sp.]